MVVLVIFAYVILVLFVLLVIVAFVPFQVVLRGGRGPRWYGVLSVSWLWRLVNVRYVFEEKTAQVRLAGMRIFSVRPGQGEKKPEEKKVKPKEKTKKKRRFPFTVREMLTMVRKTLRSLAPQGEVSGVYGTGDPAGTGMLSALVSGVLALVPIPVRLAPDFARAVLVFDARLTVRVMVAPLAVIFIRGYLRSR